MLMTQAEEDVQVVVGRSEAIDRVERRDRPGLQQVETLLGHGPLEVLRNAEVALDRDSQVGEFANSRIVEEGPSVPSLPIGEPSVEDLAVVVGVNRKAEDGYDVAALHEREQGTSVKVTPKMRGYLAARGFFLKPETTHLFIPGRPYMKPAYEDFRDRKAAEDIMVEFVEELLEGKG